MTQFSADNETFGGHCRDMYADHYSKNLLEEVNQLLGTIRCCVQFWKLRKLSTEEEHGAIRESQCTMIHKHCQAAGTINFPSSYCK